MIENHLLIKLFEFRDSCKELRGVAEDVDHAIDFVFRVIKIETGARRSGQAKFSHQRLIAMMSAAQRQSTLIGERGQIVRMHALHDKTNERAALFLRSEQRMPGNSASRSTA